MTKPMLEDRVQLFHVPASLATDDGPSFRGLVELFDPPHRFAGWVLNLSALDRPVTLELRYRDQTVGTVRTSLPRADILAAGVDAACPGFDVPTEALAGLAGTGGVVDPDEWQIRIAGTGCALRVLPQGARRTTARPAEAEPASEVPRRRAPSDPIPAPPRSLAARLEALLQESWACEPNDEPEVVGVLDAVCGVGSGELWVAGWLGQRAPLSFAATLHGVSPTPVAAALASHDRPGLPPGAQAVLGVLRGSHPIPWQSVPGTLLRFGAGGGGMALRFAPEPAVWSVADLLTHYGTCGRHLCGKDVRDLRLALLETAMSEAEAPDIALSLSLSWSTLMNMQISAFNVEEIYCQSKGAIPPPPDFNEDAYLSANPDVAAAVRAGHISNGFEHYIRWGRAEGRRRPTLLR